MIHTIFDKQWQILPLHNIVTYGTWYHIDSDSMSKMPIFVIQNNCKVPLQK